MSQNKFDIIIPPQDIEDNAQCVKRIAEGDGKAMEWLYKNYSKRLYDYALVLCSDAAVSEDIVHDVFLKIWVTRELLPKVKNFSAYIHTMVKHRVITYFERREVRQRNANELGYLRGIGSFENPLEQKETKRMLEEALGCLSKREQLFFMLTREEEQSYAEISERYGVSKNTVKNTIIHANKKLRERMKVKGR